MQRSPLANHSTPTEGGGASALGGPGRYLGMGADGRAIGIVVAVAALVAAGCAGDDDSEPADANDEVTTTIAPCGSPDEPLIAVDDAGRPYDTSLGDFARFERAQVTTLDVADGPVGVSPGEMLPWIGDDDPDVIPLELERADVTGVRIEVVWGIVDPGDTERRVPAAIVLVADPTTPVAAWDPFVFAYGTDGGSGGLSTADYRRRNGDRSVEEREAGAVADDDFLIRAGDGVFPLDENGDGRDDVVLFSNGFGDGGWPMSFGRDADDGIVEVAIWHLQGNWHAAFPEGDPPQEILEREGELAECLAGEREILDWGLCVSDV